MNDIESKPKRVTGTDLAERGLDALDVTHYEQMPVDNTPLRGQISSVDWMKVFDLGKALAAFQDGVPAHVRGKWGVACRIAADAHQWRMNPFFVADQTYLVSGRLGYMSQLIHALINRNAPLMHRLSCDYIGEGQDRQCVVRGQFISGDEREYTTPKLKDIKIKNSPLWTNDSDQQLWYYGVRAWGRKWVPEVVGGLYTKEELEADKSLGYEETAPGLHARLKGSPSSDEGHKPGHAAAELDRVKTSSDAEQGDAVDDLQHEATADTPKRAKRTSEPRRAKATRRQSDTAKRVSRETNDSAPAISKVSYPSNVAEYLAYARRWLKTESDKVEVGQRWAKERKMRNDLGVTAEDRAPLEELMQKVIGK